MSAIGIVDILVAIGGLIGAIGGVVSLLSWINTRKYEKRKAKAESDSIAQQVYERLIKTLEERNLKYECLRDDCKLRVQ